MMLFNVRIRSATARPWLSPRACATVALAAFAFAATACGCELSAGTIVVDPRTATLRIGQSFTPKAALSPGGCSKGGALENVKWITADSAVVRVDSATGRTTGVAVGTATVKGVTNLNVISTEPVVGMVTVSVTVVP